MKGLSIPAFHNKKLGAIAGGGTHHYLAQLSALGLSEAVRGELEKRLVAKDYFGPQQAHLWHPAATKGEGHYLLLGLHIKYDAECMKDTCTLFRGPL